LKEEYLLTGLLEPTNEPYAIAKIAGIKMCDAYRSQYGCHFISAMPTNLYGPNDNYDLQTSHVIPALLRKFHEAKKQNAPEVVVWGTGTPLREFMHVDDLADACLFLMERFDEPGFINVGTGKELSIRELAELIAKIVGYPGKIVFDTSKPDGTPRKLMDVTHLSSQGWRFAVSLEEGLRRVYESIRVDWNISKR
jgi:GDP-L-fucose synthase